MQIQRLIHGCRVVHFVLTVAPTFALALEEGAALPCRLYLWASVAGKPRFNACCLEYWRPPKIFLVEIP